MYPGGSGLRVEQFLNIEDWMIVKNREESVMLPYWFPEKEKTHGFIPGYQGGWAGPIKSYYSRVDTKIRYNW